MNGEDGYFMNILLGIVFDKDKKQILIIKREDDPYLKSLKWCFPGGKADQSEELSKSLRRAIKEKTGYQVDILGCIFSRIMPEKKDFILSYYLCEIVGGQEQAGGSAKELKWVRPNELRKYFTTSLDPALEEYLMSLK